MMAHLPVVDDSGVDRKIAGTPLEISCVLENDVSVLSAFIQELRLTIVKRDLFNEGDCLRYVTAVDEALLNACFHGNLELDSKLREDDGNAYFDLARQRRQEQPFCARRIHVRAEIDENHVSITVRDEGSGFNLQKLPDPTLPACLDRPHGRGILLMKAFTDSVRFNDVGNEVTLTKWIAQESCCDSAGKAPKARHRRVSR
jgi:anti-sigma regulatory factor (Ser/Thr protein kinase)